MMVLKMLRARVYSVAVRELRTCKERPPSRSIATNLQNQSIHILLWLPLIVLPYLNCSSLDNIHMLERAIKRFRSIAIARMRWLFWNLKG
jgi:hypothetical protein